MCSIVEGCLWEVCDQHSFLKCVCVLHVDDFILVAGGAAVGQIIYDVKWCEVFRVQSATQAASATLK